ncbi:conserved protein of unknown function [Georgfuchsia toluolica]|uniref:Uncharacterized protein n=1 Tax=Georgfuchsia toluolica TaxID=424218 RepID=A0A916N888_9PROT|nr:hypothetical protein [Georgfuchsia toluolica]CAG4882306.1 conserved protein of unknown function [Georgfuchsia toluolica]
MAERTIQGAIPLADVPMAATRLDRDCLRMGDKEMGKARWDAVTNGADFWSEASVPPALPTDAPIDVRVWLFGSLAADDVPRPIVLRVAQGATAASVLIELGRVLGFERFTEVASGRGEKRSICRLFVDGREVEELSAPLSVRGGSADMEMIVLAGIEGG